MIKREKFKFFNDNSSKKPKSNFSIKLDLNERFT